MISAEDISREIAPLSDEQRALVLDFARMLRERDELVLPEGPLEGRTYEAWRIRLESRSARVLNEQRRRQEAAGIAPDGAIARSEWPDDMAPSSKTSVTT